MSWRGWLAASVGLSACSGPSLTVTVQDVDGNPVGHTRVIARSVDPAIRMDCKVFEANTGSDGKVVFQNYCPQSAYLIQAQAGPQVEVRMSVEAGASEITLRPPKSANGATSPDMGVTAERQ